MPPNEPIALLKHCEAIQIPSGAKVVLPKGTQVRIMQSLGGTFTVVTEEGQVVRIDGKDADALGKGVPSAVGAGLESSPTEGSGDQSVPLEQMVWNQLRTCYDPEIPVNIVELGLVYECKITPLSEPQSGNRIEIKMTLTAPGCGMGEALRRDAQSKIERLPGVTEVNVELVWNPPWDQSRMSDAAKLQLGMI